MFRESQSTLIISAHSVLLQDQLLSSVLDFRQITEKTNLYKSTYESQCQQMS